MPAYAVRYTYRPSSTAARDEHRPAHRAFLAGLLDRGTLLASGPFLEVEGALLLFRTESEPVLRDLLAQDPFAIEGLVVEADVVAWDPVMGPFAG